MDTAGSLQPVPRSGRTDAAIGVVAIVCATYLSTLGWLLWWALLAIVMPFWQPVAIPSDSMAPRIRAGDLVVLAPVDAGDALAPGAVATFDVGDGRLVTHRIVEVRDDGTYITRGDANPIADSTPVDPDDVYGRGRLLVPAVARPLVWLRHGLWLPLATWLGATALAVVGLWLLPIGLPGTGNGRPRQEGIQSKGDKVEW